MTYFDPSGVPVNTNTSQDISTKFESAEVAKDTPSAKTKNKTARIGLLIFAALIASPIILTGAILVGAGAPFYVAGKSAQKAYNVKYRTDSPIAVCKKMKSAEESNRLDKLQKVCTDSEKSLATTTTTAREIFTTDKELSAANKELSAAKPSLTLQDVEKFEGSITALKAAIEASKNDPGEQNLEIIKKLRIALSSPVYEEMKNDPYCKEVKFLHQLAYALHTSEGSADSHMQIGEALLADRPGAKKQAEESQSQSFGEKIYARFLTADKNGRRDLFATEGKGKYFYFFTHVQQGMQAGASQGKISSLKYDPASISNASTLHGKTSITVGETTAEVQTIYGPSPTVGKGIAPEFLALCQGAKNNRAYARENDMTPDPTLPMTVVFTNLQKYNKEVGEGEYDQKFGEAERSHALMELNTLFPGVCTVITLSKDSNFYLMPKHEKHMEKITWPGAEKFKEEMKKELMGGIEKPTVEGKKEIHKSVLFFPENFDPAIFDKALDKANARFSDQEATTGEHAYALKGAYQEYVYQLIQQQMETEAVKQLEKEGFKSGNVIIKTSCKEHADRGGMNTMAYAYLRSDGSDKAINEIVGSGHYRALVAKDRMVLKERQPQVLAMIRLITPEMFKEDSEAMNSDVNIGQFVPSYSSKKAV